jgi:hypothetical protein
MRASVIYNTIVIAHFQIICYTTIEQDLNGCCVEVGRYPLRMGVGIVLVPIRNGMARFSHT